MSKFLFFILFSIPIFVSSQSNNNANSSDACIESCKNHTNCFQCSNVENVNTCYNCLNVTNSTNCINCKHVINCTNCSNVEYVEHSSNLINVTFTQYSNQVVNAEKCYKCENVQIAFDCEFCRNCTECLKCHNCEGYRCKHTEGCRNSIYKFDDITPQQDDKGWKCTNPLFSDFSFGRNGYIRPPYLSSAEIGKNLTFCERYEGKRSCCSRTTTDEIKKIFENYKDTLSTRATMKMAQITAEFNKIKDVIYINYNKDSMTKIELAKIEKMKEIKQSVLQLGKAMTKCGRGVLNHLASVLCFGCQPDYKWQKYILLNSTKFNAFFTSFDPNAMPNSTIDFDYLLSPSIYMGREACEDLFETCKDVMDTYHVFQNKTTQQVRDYLMAITDAAPPIPEMTPEKVAAELSILTNLEIEYVPMDIDLANPATLPAPSKPLTPAADSFKAQLASVGEDYPYDPTIYYSFEPSISDVSIPFTSELCKIITITDCLVCSKEGNAKECLFTKGTAFQIFANALATKVEEITDRHYREFSVFFFQVKRVNLTYVDKSTNLTFTRHFVLPPFREGEFKVKLLNETFEDFKNFFISLDKIILKSYIVADAVINGNQEFGIWHDEYWMFFIYGGAMRQVKKLFSTLNYNLKLKNFDYSCVKEGFCQMKHLNGTIAGTIQGYNSFCEECHFSFVQVRARCDNYFIDIKKYSDLTNLSPIIVNNIILEDLGLTDSTGCVVCIEILGDTEEEGSMEKCYAKAFDPFWGISDEFSAYEISDMYLEKSKENYEILRDLWDLNRMGNRKWKMYDTAEWFYKIPASMNYSIANGKKLKGIIVPQPKALLFYDYKAPCNIDFPIYDCKIWLCYQANSEFFPNFKIVYNPQDSNETEFEGIRSNLHSVYDESRRIEFRKWEAMRGENITRDNITDWVFELGSLDPQENHSFFDVKNQGILSDSVYDFQVYGIQDSTDLIAFVENVEEKGSLLLPATLVISILIMII